MRISSSLLARQPTELLRFSHGGNRRGSRPDPLRRIVVILQASFPEDPRCSHLTTSVPRTTHRYLRRTPSGRQVRTAASSSERISPHHRVTRPQFLCLRRAIQSQSRVHLCNAVVRVRHQRPATPALAGFFALLICSKTANATSVTSSSPWIAVCTKSTRRLPASLSCHAMQTTGPSCQWLCCWFSN